MDETEMVQELERFLEQLVAKDKFSGSVLVAKETHLLFKKGYGLANWDFNIPNHAETKFHLVGHSGGAPGISTQLDLYLKHDYTVVVLSNYDGPAAEHVAYKLREMLT
jgi:hypothetical protein